jgi:hypothetical protein
VTLLFWAMVDCEKYTFPARREWRVNPIIKLTDIDKAPVTLKSRTRTKNAVHVGVGTAIVG